MFISRLVLLRKYPSIVIKRWKINLIKKEKTMLSLYSYFSIIFALFFCITCIEMPLLSATIDKADSVIPYNALKVFAHRGGRRWAPENTLSAFRKSIEAGVDGIELDIQRCKSGELVVIHDDTVNRTSNGQGAIKDMTLSELRALDFGLWYGAEFKDEPLPLLSEVLDLVNGKLIINIEIKNLPTCYLGIEDDLFKELEKYPYIDKIVISSFDHQLLHQIHEKAPHYHLAMLDESNPYEIADYAKRVGVLDWNPQFDCLRQDTVDNAHRAHLQVYPWTVNDPREWERLSALGVDGIITDDPAGLMQWRDIASFF